MRGQLVSSGHTFARLCVFRYTQFHECDETAEVLVTSAVAHEDRDRAEALIVGLLNAYLGADVCFDAVLLTAEVKSRCAINSVAVEQGHRRHFHGEAGRDQLFRDGRAFEKAERRPRM